jgi:endoglucanase
LVAVAGWRLVAGLGSGPSVTPTSGYEDAALASSRHFVDTYVGDDGRVSRIDQGGSTVSEGQAYAMLLAVAVGDRDTFDRAWDWTEQNLQRPDGLLASLWEGGAIVDASPATDADVDAARALVLAADRFGDDSYRAQGLRIATAILDQETAEVNGELVLTAGPWARQVPVTINPSYFDPRAYSVLGGASGDPRWERLERSSRSLLSGLSSATGVPPDWARIEATGATPTPAPADATGVPRYGFDAVRAPVRWAAACTAENRAVAAIAWLFLGPQETGGRLGGEYALDGTALSPPNPAALVGAAASARAAGEPDISDSLLDRAEAAEQGAPSYYGAAWVALGRVMLTTDWLGSC